jgi:hypothetical protein
MPALPFLPPYAADLDNRSNYARALQNWEEDLAAAEG